MSMSRTFQVKAGTQVVVSSNAEEVKIFRIEGYVIGGTNATQYFIQILNTNKPTSGVTAPVRSLQVLGATGFTFDYTSGNGLDVANLPGWQQSAGCMVVLSSTDNVYTAPGITADINVDVEEYEIEWAGTTTIGDTTTVVSNLQVVADAPNITPRLLQLTVTETNAQDTYVQLFAINAVAGRVPIRQFLLKASQTQTWKFGSDGSHIFQQDANGTQHNGIEVALSLTSGSDDGNGLGNILAIYK